MADFPSLNIWTDALIGDTQHLDNEEFGVYLRLLIVSWRTPHCELPADDALIAKYARCSLRRWEKIKATILPFFHVKNGKLRQKRLRKERLFQIKVSRSQALRAKKRWKSEKISAASNTMGEIDNSRKPLKPNNSAYAGAMPESCLPSPSPSPSLRKEREEDLKVFQEKETPGTIHTATVTSDPEKPSTLKPALIASAFEAWWKAYPRRTGKGAALKAYTSALKRASPDELMAGARTFSEWVERNEKPPQYVPHPSTWLNQDRWLDELKDDGYELDRRISPHAQIVEEHLRGLANNPHFLALPDERGDEGYPPGQVVPLFGRLGG